MAAELNHRQRLFVEAYVSCWVATTAAKRAGYSEATAHAQGHRLLKNAEVAAAIQARIAEKMMSSDEVMLRLAEQARGTHSEYWETSKWKQADNYTEIDFSEEGTTENIVAARVVYQTHLNLERMIQDGKMHLIKSIRLDAITGRVMNVEFPDPQAALTWIGRHHKLFTDKIEATGANGESLTAGLEAAIEKAYGRGGTNAPATGTDDPE